MRYDMREQRSELRILQFVYDDREQTFSLDDAGRTAKCINGVVGTLEIMESCGPASVRIDRSTYQLELNAFDYQMEPAPPSPRGVAVAKRHLLGTQCAARAESMRLSRVHARGGLGRSVLRCSLAQFDMDASQAAPQLEGLMIRVVGQHVTAGYYGIGVGFALELESLDMAGSADEDATIATQAASL